MYDAIVIYGDNMSWIDEELNEIEKRRKEMMEAKDMKPFFKLKVGENLLEFSREKPRDNPRFAGRKVFRIKNLEDGQEYDLSVSTNSNLYREILKHLKEGKTKLKIVRVGLGKADTRYTVLSD
jgi:hypothetical protein